MSVYAKGTSVPTDRSESELRRLLETHGADELVVGSSISQGRAFVAFRLKGLNVRLDLPLPMLESFRKRPPPKRSLWQGPQTLTDEQTKKAWEQAVRERWRTLVLLTKAKLEAIRIGFSSVEREFLHDIITANGQTVGDMLSDGVFEKIVGPFGRPLLPAPPAHQKQKEEK